MAYKYIKMPYMKRGKSNNNSPTNTNGGNKNNGKRKKVVNSQAIRTTAGVGKKDKDSEIP